MKGIRHLVFRSEVMVGFGFSKLIDHISGWGAPDDNWNSAEKTDSTAIQQPSSSVSPPEESWPTSSEQVCFYSFSDCSVCFKQFLNV